MDRTQDSDSWNAGSIPAGCIDRVVMEETMNNIIEKIKPILEKIVPVLKEKKR